MEIGFAISFKILFLLLSGPEDFPGFSVYRTDRTSSTVIIILAGRSVFGSVAVDSSIDM